MRTALAILLLLTLGAGLRSPKDAGDASRLNKPMVKQVQPPLPPGYSPTTVAAAPVPALSVVLVAAPIAPYDILAPSIVGTQICFPVLSNAFVNFSTNTVLATTDFKTWTPFTNFCGMGQKMFFRLLR